MIKQNELNKENTGKDYNDLFIEAVQQMEEDSKKQLMLMRIKAIPYYLMDIVLYPIIQIIRAIRGD